MYTKPRSAVQVARLSNEQLRRSIRGLRNSVTRHAEAMMAYRRRASSSSATAIQRLRAREDAAYHRVQAGQLQRELVRRHAEADRRGLLPIDPPRRRTQYDVLLGR